MPYRLKLKALSTKDIADLRDDAGISVTKKAAASAIANLNRMDRLLASPLNWIKGKYHVTIEDHECYCLSGACSEADGPGESLAFGVLDALAPGQNMIAFNDHPSTEFRDIKRFLSHCKAEVRKLLT